MVLGEAGVAEMRGWCFRPSLACGTYILRLGVVGREKADGEFPPEELSRKNKGPAFQPVPGLRSEAELPQVLLP